MKKAVFLLSVLALAGCDEDDVKDLAQGNTKVFTVTGAQLDSSLGTLDQGYYDINAITSDMGASSPEALPNSTKSTLENLGIEIEGETCGKIDIGPEGLCFEENNSNSCLPEEISMLGLAVYTIDLDKVELAAQNGFYPTLAADVGGLYADIDYDDVSCDYLNSL